MLSVLAGFVAATSLILIAVLDTFRFHRAHKVLLLAHFGGIGVCSLLVMIVWVDQILVPGRLRKWLVSLPRLAGVDLMLTLKGVLRILSSYLPGLVLV